MYSRTYLAGTEGNPPSCQLPFPLICTAFGETVSPTSGWITRASVHPRGVTPTFASFLYVPYLFSFPASGNLR